MIRRYSEEWFEAAKRRQAGQRSGFPRRKRALIAVRYYHGTFRIDGDRLRLPVRRGSAPLVVAAGGRKAPGVARRTGPERMACSSVDRTRAGKPAIGEDPLVRALRHEGED